VGDVCVCVWCVCVGCVCVWGGGGACGARKGGRKGKYVSLCALCVVLCWFELAMIQGQVSRATGSEWAQADTTLQAGGTAAEATWK
jgi:hypothetical protein